MEPMYNCTAKLSDGRTLQVKGTIQDCANWSENVIRANGGQIEIQIVQIEGAPE